MDAIDKKIRPERNLERWSFWQAAQSKSKLDELLFERVTEEDGMPTMSRVEVRAVAKFGPLTTEDQKVYYAIQKIWEEEGRPRTIQFSLRRLSRELGKTFNAENIRSSLYRLRFTSFIWRNAYFSKSENRKISQIDTFTILSNLKVVESADKQTNKEECEAEFHPLIYENLALSYTRPLIFQTVVGFSNGIAQILYTYLDLLLSNHDEISRRSRELFTELNLTGTEYRKLSSRKRTLHRVIEELQGKALSSGGQLKVTTEDTADKTDVKLVAVRETSGLSEVVDLSATTGDFFSAKIFVQNFLDVFSHDRTPRASEIQKADGVIVEYQLNRETAIDFLRFVGREAKRTSYKPAAFQGIVKYLPKWRTAQAILVNTEPDTREEGTEKVNSEENLEAIGLHIMSMLPEDKLSQLIKAKELSLLASEKKSTYKRWTPDVLDEHVRHLVAMDLAMQLPGVKQR